MHTTTCNFSLSRKTIACMMLLLLGSTMRAELAKGFDWQDRAVRRAAQKHLEEFDKATPEDRAKVIEILLDGGKKDHAALIKLLTRTGDLDRLRTFQILDRKEQT